MVSRSLFAALLAATAVAALPSAAQAQTTTLLDVTNPPVQSNQQYSYNFVTTGPSSTITFAGYDVPSGINVNNILLTSLGGSTNLLGTTFSFSAAPCGSFAGQSGVGAFGTNNVFFAGVCGGSYDAFSQSFASTAGASYTLSFLVSNGTFGGDGLRVTASNAQLAGAVPEPGTWAMMLVGFGAMGVALRRRRRVALATVAA